jgi:predicted nucleic acid-binding protein
VQGLTVSRSITHCLDTNVLLYAFSNAARDASKRRKAVELMERDDSGVSVQALQEFYVNVMRIASEFRHEDALAVIEEIASSRPVVAIDVALVRHALQLKGRYGISYLDAAIVAAARRLGAAVLVTEDLSDGQDYGGVRVLNPFLPQGRPSAR